MSAAYYAQPAWRRLWQDKRISPLRRIGRWLLCLVRHRWNTVWTSQGDGRLCTRCWNRDVPLGATHLMGFKGDAFLDAGMLVFEPTPEVVALDEWLGLTDEERNR